MRNPSLHAPVLALALAALVAGPTGPARALDAWHVLPPATDKDLTRVDFVDDVRGWAVGVDGTIVTTTDGAASWVEQYTPVTEDVVDIRMFENGTGWALSHEIGGFPWENHSTLMKTVNAGKDWAIQHEFDHLYWALDFTNVNHGVLVGDQGEILVTDDGGVSWTPAVIDLKQNANYAIREVKFHSPMFGLGLGGQYDVTGIVWTTNDAGQTWTHRRVAGEPMFGSWVFGENDILCVGGDLDYGARTVRADESPTPTTEWRQTDLRIWGQADAVAFRDDVEGWAPLGAAGTYLYTMDSGQSWLVMQAPGNTRVMDVVFTSDRVGYMVGLDGAVLRYAGGTTTGVIDTPAGTADPAASAILFQNKPNPFRDRTQFSFRVPEEGPVTLKIYDLSGREVATVVNDEFLPGHYTRDFEVGTLASGVYYFRLATPDQVETRQLVILK